MSEQLNQKRPFQKREWVFLIILLSFGQLMTTMVIWRFAVNQQASSFVSFAGTVVSIILAVLAIIYAFYQNNEQSRSSAAISAQIGSLNKVLQEFQESGDNLTSQLGQLENLSNGIKEAVRISLASQAEFEKLHLRLDEISKGVQIPNFKEHLELYKSIESNPNNLEAKFALIDSMAEEIESQHIILMHDKNLEINGNGGPFVLEYATGSRYGSRFDLDEFRRKYEGTGLITVGGGGKFVGLTPAGHAYAEWLIKKGRKSDFFWTQFGGWGTARSGGSGETQLKRWMDNLKKQNSGQAMVEPQIIQMNPNPPTSPPVKPPDSSLDTPEPTQENAS